MKHLITEVLERALDLLREEPDYRFGQACFEALAELRPKLAEEVRGTPVDPFYTQTMDEMEGFWNFLLEKEP